MSTSYYAINKEINQKFTSPGGYGNSHHCIYSKDNPFVGMWMIATQENTGWEMIGDWDQTDWVDYEDITDELFKDYREKFTHTIGEYTYDNVIISNIDVSKTNLSMEIKGNEHNYRLDILLYEGDLIPETVRLTNWDNLLAIKHGREL